MACKISCIIPFYNVPKDLLFDCVNSILRQDFEDYEIIIVNDGSDESFAACLEDIVSLDGRIQVVHMKNRGVSAARNTGMQQAKGEFLAFVDADDQVVPYFFSEAYRAAREYHAFYVAGAELFTSDRTPPIDRAASPTIEVRDSAAFRPAVIRVTERTEDGGFFGRGPVARLIQRNIAEQIPFPEDMELGEDIIWNLDVLSQCDSVVMVRQIWYLYWKNPNSASHKYNANMVEVSERHLWELTERIDFHEKNEVIAYFFRVYEFLQRHIYCGFLGRKECPLRLFQKARMFRALCRREPWTLYQTELFFKYCGRKTRIKHLLVKSGLLFWYCLLRNRVR